MRQFSAAALIRALGTVKALFAPPCGRHSATGGRRRRSTRVRRYVPVPAQVRVPVEAATPPARTDRVPERPERPRHPERPAAPGSVPGLAPVPAPAPRLAPPSARFPAEDIALVRPYYAAREQARAEAREPGVARVRREITVRLDQRPGTNTPFSGDLLATGSVPVPAPSPALARVPTPPPTRVPAPIPAQAPASEPGPAPVPAPRPPSPACEDPEDWRAFTRLARVWLDQQQQRAERTQRAQQAHQPRAEHCRQAVPA